METENVLIEGNKMIAEFMGKDISKSVKVQGDKLVQYIPSYDVLWGLLMPVIHKISKGIATRDFDIDYDLFEESDASKIMHLRIYATIETAWQAVVEFIKFYNQSKTTKSINNHE